MTIYTNANNADLIMAHSPLTSPDLLRDYADCDDVLLRQRVAANPAVPNDVSVKLASDTSVLVRCELARNPRVPYHVLKILSDDNSAAVRLAVAECASTPIVLLHHLSVDKNKKVQARARLTLLQVEGHYIEKDEIDFGPGCLETEKTNTEEPVGTEPQQPDNEFNLKSAWKHMQEAIEKAASRLNQ